MEAFHSVHFRWQKHAGGLAVNHNRSSRWNSRSVLSLLSRPRKPVERSGWKKLSGGTEDATNAETATNGPVRHLADFFRPAFRSEDSRTRTLSVPLNDLLVIPKQQFGIDAFNDGADFGPLLGRRHKDDAHVRKPIQNL